MNLARKKAKVKQPIRVVIKQILSDASGGGFFPQAQTAAPNSSADNLGVPFTSAAVNPTAPKKKKKKKSGPNLLLIVGVALGGLALVFMLKKKRGIAGYVDDAKRRAKGFIDKVA